MKTVHKNVTHAKLTVAPSGRKEVKIPTSWLSADTDYHVQELLELAQKICDDLGTPEFTMRGRFHLVDSKWTIHMSGGNTGKSYATEPFQTK